MNGKKKNVRSHHHPAPPACRIRPPPRLHDRSSKRPTSRTRLKEEKRSALLYLALRGSLRTFDVKIVFPGNVDNVVPLVCLDRNDLSVRSLEVKGNSARRGDGELGAA